MQTSLLGHTDVEVSVLSFGGAPIGGLYAPVPHEQAERAVDRALDRGMTYLDTAPHYGAGRSERRIGRVLVDRPRASYTVSTKVGRRLRPRRPGEAADEPGFPGEPPCAREWDWSRDGIRRTLEASMERLGLDHVDVVYLHDPDRAEDEVCSTAYPALAELRDEGVVRAIGAGMNSAELLARLVTRLHLDVVLCAGRYTLLDRSAQDDLLPACERAGVSVVVGGVFNSGLLADPRPGATYDYSPADAGLLRRATALREVCTRYGTSLRAAAVQFPLRHPTVASVLVGCRSPEEVDEAVAGFDQEIPEALWQELTDPIAG
jgi:D-threo-aldose 1-dehydrogenase